MKSLKDRIKECIELKNRLIKENSSISSIWFNLTDCSNQEILEYAKEFGGEPYESGDECVLNLTLSQYDHQISIFARTKIIRETSIPGITQQELDDLNKNDGSAEDRYHR